MVLAAGGKDVGEVAGEEHDEEGDGGDAAIDRDVVCELAEPHLQGSVLRVLLQGRHGLAVHGVDAYVGDDGAGEAREHSGARDEHAVRAAAIVGCAAGAAGTGVSDVPAAVGAVVLESVCQGELLDGV